MSIEFVLSEGDGKTVAVCVRLTKRHAKIIQESAAFCCIGYSETIRRMIDFWADKHEAGGNNGKRAEPAPANR